MQEDRPYKAYSLITFVYLSLVAGVSMLLQRKSSGGEADKETSTADIFLIGVASYRLSRLIGFDRVTQYLRLPFVERNAGTEHVEGTQEKPTGTGLRRALGQLLTCTYCSSVWAATLSSALYLLFPRIGRFFLLSMAGSGIAEILDPVFPLISRLAGYMDDREQIQKRTMKQQEQSEAA